MVSRLSAGIKVLQEQNHIKGQPSLNLARAAGMGQGEVNSWLAKEESG